MILEKLIHLSLNLRTSFDWFLLTSLHRSIKLSPMQIEDYKEKIGRKIREARVAFGFSQTGLAEKMNVFPSQIARWESGKHLVDLYNAYWLSRTLNVPMDKLFGD